MFHWLVLLLQTPWIKVTLSILTVRCMSATPGALKESSRDVMVFSALMATRSENKYKAENRTREMT